MVGRKDSVNQNNYIEVSLSTADITTAKDDPDSEGIITIPSLEWDHCVTNMEDPLNPFYNKLYVNVNNIEPIVDRIVNLVGIRTNQMEITWYDTNWQFIQSNTTVQLNQNEALFCLYIGNPLRYQFNYICNTSTQISISVAASTYIYKITNDTEIISCILKHISVEKPRSANSCSSFSWL